MRAYVCVCVCECVRVCVCVRERERERQRERERERENCVNTNDTRNICSTEILDLQTLYDPKRGDNKI